MTLKDDLHENDNKTCKQYSASSSFTLVPLLSQFFGQEFIWILDGFTAAFVSTTAFGKTPAQSAEGQNDRKESEADEIDEWSFVLEYKGLSHFIVQGLRVSLVVVDVVNVLIVRGENGVQGLIGNCE